MNNARIERLKKDVDRLDPPEKDYDPLDLSPEARDGRIFQLSAEFVAGLPEKDFILFNDRVNAHREAQR